MADIYQSTSQTKVGLGVLQSTAENVCQLLAELQQAHQ
jgi:hypothetical protein